MAVPKIWRKIPEYYNLRGKKCPQCNKLYFPARDVCKNCGCIKMQDHHFIGKGQIVTYTIIRTPVSDPEGENSDFVCRNIPYVLAIIKLDEGPMLTTEIVDCQINEVNIGSRVEVVFRKILEKGEKGVIQYGYKFRLA
jgi:uncharacterized OB-fold protein